MAVAHNGEHCENHISRGRAAGRQGGWPAWSALGLALSSQAHGKSDAVLAAGAQKTRVSK